MVFGAHDFFCGGAPTGELLIEPFKDGAHIRAHAAQALEQLYGKSICQRLVFKRPKQGTEIGMKLAGRAEQLVGQVVRRPGCGRSVRPADAGSRQAQCRW